jgi:hypothetical protein
MSQNAVGWKEFRSLFNRCILGFHDVNKRWSKNRGRLSNRGRLFRPFFSDGGVPSLGNPTGVGVPRELLERAVAMTAASGVWLIVDNTYEHFAGQW